MRIRAIIFFLIPVIFLNCKRNSGFEKQTGVLDSTKIVLQVKLNDIRKSDNTVKEIISKVNTYTKFLKSNLKDTLERAEANLLLQYINSGITLRNFCMNKEKLLKETETAISQLQKLSADMKENMVPENQVKGWFANEILAAGELIRILDQNSRALTISLINVKNTTLRTEELIKNINNGQLPEIITDSIPE